MTSARTGSSDAPTTPAVEFGLLGSLRVTRDGAEVALGGRQQRAVLARLLVEGPSAVSIERLADSLWGERVTDGSVTTLQTYVSHLREALEPERQRGSRSSILVTQNGGYRLQIDDGAVDANQFTRRASVGRALLERGEYDAAAAALSSALSLWRGPVLHDLADFAFVREPAARLDAARLSVTEAWLDAEIALGHHRDLDAQLGGLVAEHPLDERLHEQRMLVAYRCGQQASALAAYQEIRRLLAEELGIDPSPSLQRLYQGILRQDPALEWQPPIREPSTATSPASLQPAATDGARPDLPRQEARRSRVAAATALVVIAGLLAVGATSSAARNDRRASALMALPANSVGRLDADGTLQAAVPVGQSPGELVFGGGSVWAANEGASSLSRIDPQTGAVAQTAVGVGPSAVAFTRNSVWVANGGDGTVSRVNARTSAVVDTIQVGNLPSAIAAAGDSVWVANTGDNTVQRIDAQTDKADAPIGVGGQPAGLAVAGNTVWVTNSQDGTVSRVDARSQQVQGPISVGAGPQGITVTKGAVWVANSSELTVSRLDPETGRQVDVIEVGDGPHTIAPVGGVLWISNEYDGSLTAIDPRTDKVQRRVDLGSSPRGIVGVGSSLWIAANSPVGTAHRGGTLTVEGAPIPGFDTIDPAFAWLPEAFAIPYDGLVALRRAGGARGATLVPDLATALPRPTNGGRQYTFTLRRGVRYSTGGEVRAGDIKRGLVRALAVNPAYYNGIVGARECAADPAHCDLTQGVVIDDQASRITFNLLAPDPDFLLKLSVHVVAIAPGVPAGALTSPAPATGPYMISGFTEKRRKDELTLVRNPHFHQWSYAAKPDGFADVIRWRRVKDGAQRLSDLLAGHADLSDPYLAGFTRPQVAGLGREHPEVVHSEPMMATILEWLNTRVPPFDDVRARRALNYAVDRNVLVDLFGGSARLSLSCQIVPPNYLGYAPYCPYTRDPSAEGVYHGPDLAAAQALVRASGTRGTPVVVWSSEDEIDQAVDRYLVQVLTSIGYRASLKVAPDHQSDAQTQLGRAWWGVDFPALSNFWDPILSCAGSRAPLDASNHGAYCNPKIDAMARQALAAQIDDPALARQRWVDVGRALTDDAPWVAGPVTRSYAVTSPRVGNYQVNPVLGPLIDQMWVT